MATDKKRVQAFLSDSLHESLSEYARGKDLSLSAAVAEVLGEYFQGDSPTVSDSELPINIERKIKDLKRDIEYLQDSHKNTWEYIKNVSSRVTDVSNGLWSEDAKGKSVSLNYRVLELERKISSELPSESISELPSELISELPGELISELPGEKIPEMISSNNPLDLNNAIALLEKLKQEGIKRPNKLVAQRLNLRGYQAPNGQTKWTAKNIADWMRTGKF